MSYKLDSCFRKTSLVDTLAKFATRNRIVLLSEEATSVYPMYKAGPRHSSKRHQPAHRQAPQTSTAYGVQKGRMRFLR